MSHQLFLQALLICVFPLAVYCWLLGMLNRRLHPMMVSGRWDFVGLLFAASGFLLVVGPVILTGLYYRALQELPQRHQGRPGTALLWEFVWEMLLNRWAVFVAYYLLIVGGALFLLWWRGRKTVVYNVNPVVLDRALADTLDRMGSGWTRRGNRLSLTAAAPALRAEPAFTPQSVLPPTASPEGLPTAPDTAEQATLELESFPAMYNVTLHWRSGPPAVREGIETGLTRALANVETEDNPAGTWMLGVSTCLFGLMFVSVLVIILGTALAQRRW